MNNLKIIITGEYEKDECSEGWCIENIAVNQDIDEDILLSILEGVIVTKYIDNNLSLRTLIYNIKNKYKGWKKEEKKVEREMKRDANSKK